MRFPRTLFALPLLLLGFIPSHAQSSACTTTEITVNATGNVTPLGINSSGLISGTFFDSGFGAHGFLWSNGKGHLYDFPGASQTFLGGINDQGVAAGTLINDDGSSAGFTLNPDGSTNQFSVPFAFNTNANGINNHGQIVGTFQSGDFQTGFLRTGNTFTTIQFPGAVSTIPMSINDAGVIVGDYFDGNSSHGFVSFQGRFVTFDFPGASSTDVRGINNGGEIVGEVRLTADGQGQGFTFDHGKFTTFQFPGSTFTEFSGVNAQGDRVGDAVTSDVNGFLSGPGFLLTCR